MESAICNHVIKLSGYYGVVVDVCTSVQAAMTRSGLHELIHAGEAVREAADAAHDSLRSDLGGIGRDEPNPDAWINAAGEAGDSSGTRLVARFFRRSIPTDTGPARGDWAPCGQDDVPEPLLLFVNAAIERAAEAYCALVRREAGEI